MSCTTQIVYHELYGRRGFTSLHRTWNRYLLFLTALSESPLSETTPLVEAPAATENDLLQVHSEEYVDLVQQLDLKGEGKLDGSTPAWHGMYARAERVVGGTLLGSELILSGAADHIFNPAGGQHHAHQDRGGGFCVFNDVVTAVRNLQSAGVERIAVLDLDGHHGDGTESLLATERVMTISLHQYGERTYPGTGPAEDIGRFPAEGYTVNLPLARGTGGDAYLRILSEVVEPILRGYAPEFLIVQFGTDGHTADPLLRLCLTADTYLTIARWFHRLAHELCHGRLLVVGGGGYSPPHVVPCWLFMLAQLSGCPPHAVHPAALAWLGDAPPPIDPEADATSLAVAAITQSLIFPLQGLAIPAHNNILNH